MIDPTTVAAFIQILLMIAIPVLVAAAVGLAVQGWKYLSGKISGNTLFQLQQIVKTIADAARQSGLLTQLTAAEKTIEASLVAEAQAFADVHHVPIGSVASLVALVKAELLKDLQVTQTPVTLTVNSPVKPPAPPVPPSANNQLNALAAAIAAINQSAAVPPTVSGGMSGYVPPPKSDPTVAPAGTVG